MTRTSPERTPLDEPAWIHPSAVVDDGAQIGRGTRVWHFCHVMAGARIGCDCVLGQGCFVASGAVVGSGVRLQNNVSVFEGVTLEDDVFCGPSAVFTNVRIPRSAVPRKHELRRTRVGRGASIGANATLVCGADVGAYAMIGAGAVVTRDVPEHALVVGNPARVVGWVSRRGLRLRFDAESLARCPEGGESYRLAEGRLIAL
jgi:UDP-2-acetamido-3-amino-2,3-dideoxy-glucuronate N-acetyltransferase